MSTLKTTVDQPTLAGRPTAHADTRALLGQVMGLVAVTVGFSALGAYLGRDLSGATGLVLFIGAFGCLLGLNIAATKGREQLAIALLFGLGLLLGLAVAPVIADYANADPSALWQSAGATAAFVAAAGAYGYATRRDLSSWGRTLFWALLGLIAFGIVAIFVSIPNENAILAGGCFWGVQELLRRRDGVISTRVGYTGGENENPTYRNHPGHAEAVEILFDPLRISYPGIL